MAHSIVDRSPSQQLCVLIENSNLSSVYLPNSLHAFGLRRFDWRPCCDQTARRKDQATVGLALANITVMRILSR